MAFTSLREAPEAEVARLAEGAEGSTNRFLSTLPVNIEVDPIDLLIQIPLNSDHRIVVVPFKHHPSSHQRAEGEKFRRYSGSYDCIVVASDHASYPVGGHRINLSGSQLARGTQITI